MTMRWGRLLGAVLLTTACFRHASLSPTPNPNVITRAEIRSVHAASIYDAIAQLRPQFLRDRGSVSIVGGERDVATVFLNSQAYGSISAMRQLPATDFSQVRYYSGIDAVTKFGRAYGGGVIQLISRDH